jgi:HK97 family phage major capsid protein
MKTIAEQIAAFEAKRAASVARMDELIIKAGDEGRTFEDAEKQEHAGLDAEVKQIDEHLVILKSAERRVITGAAPITSQNTGTADDAARARSGAVQAAAAITWGKSNLPKGTAFTRYAIAVLRAKGDSYRMMEIAKQWKDSTPEVEIAVKAAVAAGRATDSAWAAPLVVYQNMANEFIEILRPATIIGRIQGLRRVPFNISMPRATAGTTSSWVGEDDPKPVSRMSLETITLGHSKIATIVVLTEELVQDSSPSAEAVVRQDMIEAVSAYADAQFIDPTVTASGTVRPASITQGLTDHPMTGTAVTNVITDMQTLMQTMISGNIRMRSPVWIMHPRTALYLSMLLSPLGTMQFPGINMSGGTFLGYPVITSASVPIDTGNDTYIVLMDASEILLADEGGIRVDVSREASLQMDGAPTDAAASHISLWQNNLVGLRVEQRINYRRRRDAAVAVLSDVSY